MCPGVPALQSPLMVVTGLSARVSQITGANGLSLLYACVCVCRLNRVDEEGTCMWLCFSVVFRLFKIVFLSTIICVAAVCSMNPVRSVQIFSID